MRMFDAAVITAGIFIAGLSGYFYGMEVGDKRAYEKAYSTNPVSDRLEMVCAGLWVGQQNVMAWRKAQEEQKK